MRQALHAVFAAVIVLVLASPARADLLTSLIGHWKLNEASGTRVDSHGTNDLTDNNTVGQAAGKIDNASSHVRANSEYLFRADNTDLSTGDIDYTISGWFYPETSLANTRTWAQKKDEWWLHYNGGLKFMLQGGGGTNRGTATSSASISVNNWYFVVAWHDTATNKVYIQVNDGTVDEAATTDVGNDSGLAFGLGGSGFGDYYDGRVDSFSFWKRLLTAQERTDLYNSGAGLDYPFSTATPRSFGTILFKMPTLGWPVGPPW